MVEPTLYSPQWWQRRSGLWLHSSLQESPNLSEVPPDLRSAPSPVAIERRPPSSDDQVFAHIDEQLLGLSQSTLPETVAWARQIHREAGLAELAELAARVFAAGHQREPQVQTSRWFFGDQLTDEDFVPLLDDNPSLMVFSEQHVNMLMRLVIQFGFADGTLDAEHHRALRMGLLAATSVTLTGAGTDREAWMGLIMRSGNYSSKQTPALLLGRAQRLRELAQDEKARDSAVYCDLDAWAITDYGLTPHEQANLGLAFCIATRCFNDHDDDPIKLILGPEAIDQALRSAGLLDKRRQALDLISSSATEFDAAFERNGNTVDHLIWDARPFKTAPFLRTDGGYLVLLSPRFLHSWVGEGFYYRGLLCAQQRRCVETYTSFMGEAYERYCVELAAAVHPHGKLASASVLGERSYRHKRGESKSPDLAISVGPDLVLVEITNRRLLARALINGSYETVLEQIDLGITEKAEQLNDRIDDLLRGDAHLPGVNLAGVRRIYPVLISASMFLQTPLLWAHLDQALGNAFGQARVQPPTLLDPEDFELLCELVYAGDSIPQLLARKTLPMFARNDFQHWIAKDHPAPKRAGRIPPIREALDRSWEPMLANIRDWEAA